MNNMKFILLCIILTNISLMGQVFTVDRELEAKQAALWRSKLKESSDKPEEQKFDILSLGLRNMGYRRSFDGHSDEIADVFSAIQNEFVKAPNHALYFYDKLEQARNQLPEGTQWHTGPHNDFQSLRVMIIRDTLCHLPSPEVVRILGNYLNDERDTPPPMTKFQDWIDSEANAYLACTALQKIGLRDSPLPVRAVENADNLATWKLWWGPIQAGNRSFSFEGQDVEYRFRKDGTYETIARSNTTKHMKQVAQSDIDNAQKWIGKPAQRWLVLLCGCAALFAWLRWRAKKNVA